MFQPQKRLLCNHHQFLRLPIQTTFRRQLTVPSLVLRAREEPRQEEAEEAAENKPKGVSGLITSFLHGSQAAKAELNDTFSKVLARGKYVHELQSKFLPLAYSFRTLG